MKAFAIIWILISGSGQIQQLEKLWNWLYQRKSWFWPPTWSDWTLAIVGAIGICVAIRTLKAIRKQNLTLIRQTRILLRQTKATEIAAKATKDSVKLQRAGMRQWVRVENWNLSVRNSEFPHYQLQFDVVNETSLPLTITVVSISGTLTLDQKNEIILVPKGVHRVDAIVQLTEEETSQRDESTFVKNIRLYSSICG